MHERVCTDMNWCGLTLDVECNVSTASVEEKASVPDSRLEADVIPVDEGSRYPVTLPAASTLPSVR